MVQAARGAWRWSTVLRSSCGVLLLVLTLDARLFSDTAHKDEFVWFGHSWSHSQPHIFINLTSLLEDMRLNEEFSKVTNCPWKGGITEPRSPAGGRGGGGGGGVTRIILPLHCICILHYFIVPLNCTKCTAFSQCDFEHRSREGFFYCFCTPQIFHLDHILGNSP